MTGECGHCTLPQMYSLDLNEAVCITSIFRSLQPNVQYHLFWEGVFGPLWGCNEKQPPAALNTGSSFKSDKFPKTSRKMSFLFQMGYYSIAAVFVKGILSIFPCYIRYDVYLSVVTGKNLRFHSGFVMNIHGLMDFSQISRLLFKKCKYPKSLPSWELTYPFPEHSWVDDIPFSKSG